MRILINKKSICFCSHSDKISHRLEHVEYEKSFPTRSNMKEIENKDKDVAIEEFRKDHKIMLEMVFEGIDS